MMGEKEIPVAAPDHLPMQKFELIHNSLIFMYIFVGVDPFGPALGPKIQLCPLVAFCGRYWTTFTTIMWQRKTHRRLAAWCRDRHQHPRTSDEHAASRCSHILLQHTGDVPACFSE
jgi:hypothetical protein